jgi:hypothetical protein
MPSLTRRILTPGPRCRIGNRPILASRAKYFNENISMAKGEGLKAKGRERTNVKGPYLLPFAFRPPHPFHDSFNLDAELKETLNESSGLRVPFASSSSDIIFNFNRLREIYLWSTPWHIGCKPFRRFE